MHDDADLLDHPIDARARRAAGELHRLAAERALPVVPQRRVATGRTIAIAVAVLALIVGGLIVIGNRDGDSEPAGPNDDLHWVIDDLPDGYQLVDVSGPGTGNGQPAEGTSSIVTVFGTSDAPLGPVFETFAGNGLTEQPAEAGAFGATSFDEHTVDGVDVVLATSGTGKRLAWAKLGEGWVSFHSAAMSDEELLSVAGHALLQPDLTVQIDGAYLPEGVTRLAGGPIPLVIPAWWAGYDAQGTVPGTITVNYAVPSGTAGPLSLAVSREVGGQMAYLAMSTSDLTDTVVDGVHVWLVPAAREGSPRYAAWVRDGHFFLLASVDDLDLAALAASVRYAGWSEWSDLVAGNASDGGPGVTELPSGTVDDDDGQDAPPETDPPPTDPPAGTQVRDIDLDWTISDAGPHEATLTTSLPDGTRSSLRVTIVGGGVSVGSADLGSISYNWSVTDPDRLEWQGIGAIAFTRDPAATQLRVRRANGDRYTMDLVSLSGVPDTKFAALTLRHNDFVSADLLDADGDVLQHFESGSPTG